ncbi:MAG: hypothetical protein JO047_16310 [Alphaproteobacteria bacterium]|nr:hypothetical protein [Alphaproteobacteria bacterium]
MPPTVDVVIPVDREVAESLADPRSREAVGRIVSRMLRPPVGADPLLSVMQRLKDAAQAQGLTDEIVDGELAAYNAERRA